MLTRCGLVIGNCRYAGQTLDWFQAMYLGLLTERSITTPEFNFFCIGRNTVNQTFSNN